MTDAGSLSRGRLPVEVAVGWLALMWGTTAQAAPALSCPPGAAVAEVVGVEGLDRYCARPDGTPHGPWRHLDADGRLREEGQWTDGVAVGVWRRYDAAGKLIETGQLVDGLRQGAWTHHHGAGSATLTYDSARPDDAWSGKQPRGDARSLWRVQLDRPATALAAGEDTVAVVSPAAGGGANVVVLERGSGRRLAEVGLSTGLRAGLTLGTDHLIAVTGPGELLWIDGLRAEDDATAAGPRVLKVRTATSITHAGPVLSDGTVLVRDGQGRVGGLDLDTGALAWSGKVTLDAVSPVAVGDVAVGVRGGREVRATEVGTGEFAWQARMSAPVAGLLAGPDRVLVWTRAGELLALSADTGAPLWSEVVAPPPGVQWRTLAPRLRVSGGSVVVETVHQAVVLGVETGDLLHRFDAQMPDGADGAADLVVSEHHACTTGRTRGLRCQPGDWSAPTSAPALPPVITEDAVVVATQDGQLTAIDTTLGPAIAGGAVDGGRVLLDVELTTVLEVPAALPGLRAELPPGESEAPSMAQDAVSVGVETESLTLPYVVVERDFNERDTVCTRTTAMLGLPDAAWARDGEEAGGSAASAPWVWLESLLLDPDLGEGDFTLDPAWTVEPDTTTWQMSWWHHHRGVLSEVVVPLADPQEAAQVDALLRCETPPGRFAGRAVLDDGYRTTELEGLLEITPHPHSVDGVPGCLLDVAVSGEDLGSWSSPLMPAWSEVVLSVTDPVDWPVLDAVAEGDPAAVPEQVEGDVVLDVYTPWHTDRTRVSHTGRLALQVGADPVDPAVPVLRAYRLPGDVRPAVEVAVSDLRYGRVEIDDEDGVLVPVPRVEERVHLGLALPDTASPDAEHWRVVWTRSSCVSDELDGEDAGDDAASPLPDPPAVAPGVGATPSEARAVPDQVPTTMPPHKKTRTARQLEREQRRAARKAGD